jgi:ComF family protein
VGLLDLLVPERCAACGAEDEALCDGCLRALCRIREPVCERCGAPVAWPVARCRECAGRRLAFATARAAVAYEGPAVRLVGAWKNRGRRCLADVAADLVAEVIVRPEGVTLTFVPAVPDRGLWRGHNPAERLARALGERWELPVRPLVARAGAPRPQRGLPLAERRRNVARGFVAAAPVRGRVVLVDDVYTTGSTVAAVASALVRGGARRVDVVTLARVLRGR